MPFCILREWSTKTRTERAGFEPAVRFDPHAALAKRCFRPLSHLSHWGYLLLSTVVVYVRIRHRILPTLPFFLLPSRNICLASRCCTPWNHVTQPILPAKATSCLLILLRTNDCVKLEMCPNCRIPKSPSETMPPKPCRGCFEARSVTWANKLVVSTPHLIVF